MTTRSEPKPPPTRHKNELEEARAKRVLKLLLMGLEGAVLTHITTVDADHRARIRSATHATRRALDADTTAHAALLEHLAPLFVATPGAHVERDDFDE